MDLVNVDGYFKRISCDNDGNRFLDVRNLTHLRISQLAASYNIQNPPRWTNWNIFECKTHGGNAYIHNFIISWIKAYKDVIKEAANIIFLLFYWRESHMLRLQENLCG